MNDLLGNVSNALQLVAEGFQEIDHIAIAVHDLEKATTFLSKLGFVPAERRKTLIDGTGMESVVVKAGKVKLVLLMGIGEESQVSRFIARHGVGIHHVAIRVDDLRKTYATFNELNIEFQTELVDGGELIQCFVQRDDELGIMIELIERVSEEGFTDNNVQNLFAQMQQRNAI